MAAATAPPPSALAKVSTADLLLALADAPLPIDQVQAKFSLPAIARAWVMGQIEFGRAKYCIAGAPDGKHCLPPGAVKEEERRIGGTLVIETGIEWSGPKARWHGPLAKILAETMPTAKYYQIYQPEVQTSRYGDPERWEWLRPGEEANGRETRLARRDVKREDCERVWTLLVRVTDTGLAAIRDE